MTTEPGGRRGTRPGLTVRARVLAAVLTLSALGLAGAGGAAYLLQYRQVDREIDAGLVRDVTEFRTRAADGVDPGTGAPFTAVEDLLTVALRYAVPAPHEGALAMIDGRVRLTAPDTVRLRIEDDPELVAAAARAGRDAVALSSLTTAERSYRYAAVPVSVSGDPDQGVLVFAVDRSGAHAALAAAFRTYALVAVAALVVTGVAGWLVAGRLLAPIRLLRRTAQQIGEADLSARIPVRGDDDLSELARTVNAMLDRIEAAFVSQRRLLDDAGHELRTPLTIVRGHLELVDPSDPDDVAATRTLVLDEVDRMHGLVDDLVTLATADRPDFVRPVATDVAGLTADVVDKARLLGDHRWAVAHVAPVSAAIDPQRVTQALLQLAANATKFAPAGSLVRVASESRDGRLLLSVTDEGPGVAPADAERIFERFGRGTIGRGVEGSGLGLPIVAAIAAAHGGRAYVAQPESGRGARFVVDLPLVRPAPPVGRPGAADDGGTGDGAAGATDESEEVR